MFKIVVMYQTPSDPDHFKSYYESNHLPLSRTMPGMLASRHSFAITAPDGSSPYFCIWEGEFADGEAAGAAMQSEIGQKVAADTANYTDAPFALIMYTTTEG
jgi:uncharacterized protein (TIGR02118 family)